VRAPLVVVMGVSGVGKSRVANELAAAIGVECADGDDFHSAANIAAMQDGTPLTDEDRQDWLDAIGLWLAAHDDIGGVISCSALKRAYRDRLRASAPRTAFAHLTADHDTIRARMQAREHFMPSSLLDSQEQLLEPLEHDEAGWTIDSTLPAAEIVQVLAAQVSGR
jgi:gluconokinase